MFYKLYKTRSKNPTPRGRELFKEFHKIYKEHDVRVVGVWENKNDPKETYLMTAYKDESHFQKFSEDMKSHPKYIEMGKEMTEDRKSVEVVDLKLFSDSPQI
ncbi:MAG: hypothetical protein HeimC2_37860 [Candidatus Heimdallarchaeota archaeon LC_2]|nr:MAG: hypothetical protein HeimC2_37860 [Candidatus Heimdallarchaeota archaeon LC_2]